MEHKNGQHISYRKKQIADKFLAELDKHLADLKNGDVETSFGIRQIAELMLIDPNHLSDTVRKVLGKSPCSIFEEKLIDICKMLIIHSDKPIGEIAYTFDYEPSNFIKLFKRYTGNTPLKFRNHYFLNMISETEKNTI
jgi:AraC family transcriptional regulator of adaptative response / methylphosphotriester-DNA alkyltransferase methyltransferase